MKNCAGIKWSHLWTFGMLEVEKKKKEKKNSEIGKHGFGSSERL